MPTVSITTLGCRLNQAETAQMAASFRDAGYCVLPAGEPADVCVIHSCAVTARAANNGVRLARAARRRRPDAVVVIAGCSVEADREGLGREAAVDFAVGQQDKFDLPRIVGVGTNTSAGDTVASSPSFADRTRAFVKVQDGCDFRCSYCIVPHTRGAPRSRPAGEVLKDVCALAGQGHREVVLSGANLGLYGDGGTDLVGLIRRVEDVDGIERIRLSSVESSTVERRVVDHMTKSAKLCRFLHIPIQSGDDGVLSAMRRRYTVSDYRRLVEYAAERVPLLGLGTDVLVGFPGETDAAFENTVRTIESLPFTRLHVFVYSPRPHTAAADLGPQVAATAKRERSRRIMAIGAAKSEAFARQFVGREVSVLVERPSVAGQSRGWTGEYVPARLTGVARPGTVIQVVPTHSRRDTLLGQVP